MNDYNKMRLKVIETEILLQSVNSRSDMEDTEFIHDILKYLMETYEFDFEGWTDSIEQELIAENNEPTMQQENEMRQINEATAEERLRYGTL